MDLNARTVSSGWKTTDPSLFLLFRVYCHQYLKQEDVFSMKQLIYLALVIICGAALLKWVSRRSVPRRRHLENHYPGGGQDTAGLRRRRDAAGRADGGRV